MFSKNKVYLIDKNNNKKEIPILLLLFKGLNLKFKGKCSQVIFYDSIPNFYKSSIKLGNNCTVEFRSNKEKIKHLLIQANTDNAICKIGKDFRCSGCEIHFGNEANLSVNIGNDCLFAENIIIRPSDSHTIFDSEGEITNKGNSIHIGNHVWCSSRVVILKNTNIANNVVVGLGSIVTKDCNCANSIYAGIPAQLIKKDISWDRQHPEKEIINV